jgi:hypothetical protein
MKYFVITTKSESSDSYSYLIKSQKTPTRKQIDKFLKKNANDIDEDGNCWEYFEELIDVSPDQNFLDL